MHSMNNAYRPEKPSAARRRIFAAATLLMGGLSLGGCSDSSEVPVPQIRAAPVAPNPISTFCGEDCARCDYNQEKCLRLLAANLRDLCDNTKENCYEKWQQYAQTCKSSCVNMNNVAQRLGKEGVVGFLEGKPAGA